MTQETVKSRKRRGPPPTGKGEPVLVRLQPNDLADLDGWINLHAPAVTRPEALRRLMWIALFERESPTANWGAELVASLDAWISKQPDKPSRSEAIRRIAANTLL